MEDYLIYLASWTLFVSESNLTRAYVVHNVKTPFRSIQDLKYDKELLKQVVAQSKIDKDRFVIDGKTKLPKVREIEFLTPLTANFIGYDKKLEFPD